MLPDFEMLDWLASVTGSEVPYVQYQALNGLLVAVRLADPQLKLKLVSAIEKAKAGLSSADADVSRWNLATRIEEEVTAIPNVSR